MTRALDSELVRELAKVIVEKVEPDELPLFSAVAGAYVSDPERAILKRDRDSEPLRFGIESAVALVTPIAVFVATEVIRHLADQLVPPAVASGRRAAGRSIRRLFRRPPSARSALDGMPAEFTADQLAQVHRIAGEKARQAGLPEDKADLIADALIGGLRPAGGRRQR